MSERVPDAVEPVIGWRMWRTEPVLVQEVGHDPVTAAFEIAHGEIVWPHRLFSLMHETVWPVRAPLQAKCSGHPAAPAGSRPNHLARCDCVPDQHQSCGIYAMKELHDVLWGLPRLKESLIIIGQVALWGRLVVHEHGYRAAYGYPHRLYVPLWELPRQGRLFQVPGDARERTRRGLEAYGVPVEIATVNVSLEPWR